MEGLLAVIRVVHWPAAFRFSHPVADHTSRFARIRTSPSSPALPSAEHLEAERAENGYWWQVAESGIRVRHTSSSCLPIHELQKSDMDKGNVTRGGPVCPLDFCFLPALFFCTDLGLTGDALQTTIPPNHRCSHPGY